MAELRSHAPSLRDRIAWAIAGGAEKLGADKHRQQWTAQKAGGLLDFIPGVGEALGVDDAWGDYQSGNYGMAAAGLGLTAAGVVPVVGDIGANVVKGAMRNGGISSIGGLRETLKERGPLYVRWSRGPEFDMRPGAASRDYQSGQSHDGLSAIEVADDMSDDRLLKFIKDYSFLRMKDSEIRPHIYSARKIGLDSDGADTIRPTEFLGTLSDDTVKFLDDETSLKRLVLIDQINTNKKALEIYKNNPPKHNPVWTEKTLADLQSELHKLGGPIELPK